MIVTTNTTIIHASHFAIEWKKNPGHGIHRSNGALLSKISGKLQPSPPPGFFWSAPASCSSSIIIHASVGVPPWYMQCSLAAFEKLGNKKPPCFPPRPLNFFIWKVRKRFLFVCWRDARGRGTRLTGHLQHFSSNTWDACAAAGVEFSSLTTIDNGILGFEFGLTWRSNL